jgi:hypothetical protein
MPVEGVGGYAPVPAVQTQVMEPPPSPPPPEPPEPPERQPPPPPPDQQVGSLVDVFA